MTWVRSNRGRRRVHWRQPNGALLCADANVRKPSSVEPAELTTSGNPIGVVCELCRLRCKETQG